MFDVKATLPSGITPALSVTTPTKKSSDLSKVREDTIFLHGKSISNGLTVVDTKTGEFTVLIFENKLNSGRKVVEYNEAAQEFFARFIPNTELSKRLSDF